MSESRAVNLATKLNLSPSEREFFVDLALSEHARSAVLREMALQRVNAREEAFEKIGEDQFAVISDWYYTAITQILQLKDFEPTIENISHRLGLLTDVTEKALERLEAMSGENKRRWDMGCTMVPTSREKAKEIAAKIRQFRLEAMADLQNSENKDSLFALSTSFFEMTDVQPH